MRYLTNLSFFGVLIFFTQCSGQTKSAVEAQKAANEVLEQTATPGESPSQGLFMKATIGGKPWVASKLIPDASIGSNEYRVTGSGDGKTIGFYVYLPSLKAGREYEFREDNAADLITDDDIGFYGGRAGKFVITKVDDQGFEGTFYFTANTKSAPNKIEVTGGSLRFPFAKRK